jgi:stage II sporulation protein M
MRKAIWRSLTNHFRDNLILYVLLSSFMVVGILLGSSSVKSLNSEQINSLGDYFNNFVSTFPTLQIQPEVLTTASFAANIKLLLLIWFLGLTVLGVPIIFLAITVKGFYLGFTAGFIIQEKGLRGILFTAITLLPQNFLIIPSLVIAGVVAASFSLWLLRGRFKNPYSKISQMFFSYTFVFCILGIVTTCGSFLEGYVTPWLIKAVIANF